MTSNKDPSRRRGGSSLNVRTLILFATVTLLGTAAQARSLAEIKAGGDISVCSNPNALPYASNKPQTPGFQIEIARLLAQKLGVNLRIEWIIPRMRSNMVDCDILMDTIVRPGVHPPSVKLSMPYHISGVSLVFGRGQKTVESYKALPAGMRVGVVTNSLASTIVGKTPAIMVPFGFEDDLVEGLTTGDVAAGALSPNSVGYFNFRNPDKALTIVHAEDGEPELRWGVAVGVRRSDEAIVTAINEAIAALLADGSIKAAYARYGVEHRQP